MRIRRGEFGKKRLTVSYNKKKMEKEFLPKTKLPLKFLYM